MWRIVLGIGKMYINNLLDKDASSKKIGIPETEKSRLSKRLLEIFILYCFVPRIGPRTGKAIKRLV